MFPNIASFVHATGMYVFRALWDWTANPCAVPWEGAPLSFPALLRGLMGSSLPSSPHPLMSSLFIPGQSHEWDVQVSLLTLLGDRISHAP